MSVEANQVTLGFQTEVKQLLDLKDDTEYVNSIKHKIETIIASLDNEIKKIRLIANKGLNDA